MVDQVELVERVARALFDREWNASDVAVRNEVWVSDEQRAYFTESARAALEASHHAELVEALESIAQGRINTDFVMSNPPDWHTAFGDLQALAKAALAKVRTPTTPERSDDE